ncbi:condensin-2 complex subunit H2 [Osmerus eperlanus]|uniref:condensin-2 complex subunit H2 n=1 Tax=Osmerus eperlanus TaxID=29151 RepID=UPI002E14AF51
MTTMDSAETRFAHLLQPIRELTKNWDVDVAAELADYLEELDEMCITFDGGKTTLNFAEAALLIQGSTCIYSKKVEHLYNLVYQTLDYISARNKKREKQAASGEEGGENAGADGDDMDNAGMESLDQTSSETSQNVELRNESNASVAVVPLPPDSLIPPEPFEKQKLPLISLKGEVLGSCKDFRMNTFTPDALGIIRLILDTARCNFLGEALLGAPMAPISLFHHQDDAGQVSEVAGMGVAGDDHEDGGEPFLPLEDGAGMEQEPEEHIERHQALGEGRVLRARRGVQSAEGEQSDKRMEEQRAQAANAWRLHDPYTPFGEDKPLKTGKCYKVPAGLDDSGKRKRKGPSGLQDFLSWYTGTYNPTEPKLKNGPAFTDLNYIYLSRMKDKLKTKRRILRKTGVLVCEEELRRTYLEPEERGATDEEEGRLEGLRHPDLQGPDDDLSDDDHEPLADDPADHFGGEPDFIAPEPMIDGMSYEDLVKKSVEQFLVNSQGYAQETALSRRVKDWEDKINPELRLQEERPTFDIRDYGDRIVSALAGVGHRRSLASIVHGTDNFEACKYLLASLQLANDYTVEIDCSEGLEESVDSMGLTLLSERRAHERFNKAPAATAHPI